MACRVLVVEDDEGTAYALGHMFRLHGFDVRIAYDGAEALAAAHQHRPHIGFLDLELPDITGFELARQLRHRLGRAIVLIAVSGLGEPDDVGRAMRSGFDAHYTKPADPGKLVALARGAFAGSME